MVEKTNGLTNRTQAITVVKENCINNGSCCKCLPIKVLECHVVSASVSPLCSIDDICCTKVSWPMGCSWADVSPFFSFTLLEESRSWSLHKLCVVPMHGSSVGWVMFPVGKRYVFLLFWRIKIDQQAGPELFIDICSR